MHVNTFRLFGLYELTNDMNELHSDNYMQPIRDLNFQWCYFRNWPTSPKVGNLGKVGLY